MLATDTDPSALAGLEIVDLRGERIGRVRQVYPGVDGLGWVGVRGNLFGTEEALVPLDGAVLEDDVIGVAVSRGRFQSAPRRRPDATLGDEEQEELRRFWAEPPADEHAEEAPAAAASIEYDASGLAAAEESGTDDHLVVTASEERLVATTERVPRTRVRLRKVVVTEERTLTVPVRREEYRLVREPIADGVAVPGGSIESTEQEVVLYEERVIVTTEVVPVERVRLLKEDVVEERRVTGTVRRERIEVQGDSDPATTAAPTGSEPEPPQPLAAPAMATKRSTSSASPRRPGSTPARSSTVAAADAPPSTGASD